MEYLNSLFSDGSNLFEMLWNNIFQALGIILAGYLVNLLRKVADKYKIDMNKAQEEALKTKVADAIHYAEEYAWKKLKLDQKSTDSEEKLASAVSQLMTQVPGLTKEAAESLIMSYLPQIRSELDSKIKSIVEDKLVDKTSENTEVKSGE